MATDDTRKFMYVYVKYVECCVQQKLHRFVKQLLDVLVNMPSVFTSPKYLIFPQSTVCVEH